MKEILLDITNSKIMKERLLDIVIPIDVQAEAYNLANSVEGLKRIWVTGTLYYPGNSFKCMVHAVYDSAIEDIIVSRYSIEEMIEEFKNIIHAIHITNYEK